MEIFYYNGEIYFGEKDVNGVPSEESLVITDDAILSVINFIHEKDIKAIKLESVDDVGYTLHCEFEENVVDNQEPICYNDQVKQEEEVSNITNIF